MGTGTKVDEIALLIEADVFAFVGVLMAEFQWDGRPESAGAPGNAHVTGDSGAADTADATDYPTAPPPDFDWEAELAEHPLHHCETCAAPRPDCKKERHA